MKPDDYRKTWTRIWDELNALQDRRTALENELAEIKTQVAHLDEVLDHLGPLAGITSGDTLTGLGFTDAIRRVVAASKDRMTASDVRRVLTEKGFDFSGLTAPMASIYKILSRLHEGNEIEREREDGTVYWKKKADDLVQSTEITDDDIPF